MQPRSSKYVRGDEGTPAEEQGAAVTPMPYPENVPMLCKTGRQGP